MLDVSRYTVLDFETTGLTKPVRPVSLGIMVYENNKRIHHDYFECNPEAEINERAFEVHHIPQERVDKLDNFSHFWERVRPYIENSLLVGHNLIKYDINTVLIPTLSHYGIAIPTMYMVDTMDIAKKVMKIKTDDGRYNLESCCRYFNIPIDNHHHAAYDIFMTQRIFAHEYNELRGEIEETVIEGDYDPRKGETPDDVELPF